MVLRSLCGAAVLTALCISSRIAHAQERVTVSGVVRDAASSQPIHGAVVTLAGEGSERASRTDEGGAFAFGNVSSGAYSLTVKRLGYEWARVAVQVLADTPPLAISLPRIVSLDTVRVRATRQGIYGVVGTASDLRPLPFATVQILGQTILKVPVDSMAHFFVPLRTPGSYLLRARAAGAVASQARLERADRARRASQVRARQHAGGDSELTVVHDQRAALRGPRVRLRGRTATSRRVVERHRSGQC